MMLIGKGYLQDKKINNNCGNDPVPFCFAASKRDKQVL